MESGGENASKAKQLCIATFEKCMMKHMFGRGQNWMVGAHTCLGELAVWVCTRRSFAGRRFFGESRGNCECEERGGRGQRRQVVRSTAYGQQKRGVLFPPHNPSRLR